MVATFHSNGPPTPLDLSQIPKQEFEEFGKNGPTCDTGELLWQSTRCWVEGRYLELVRAKPDMIGHRGTDPFTYDRGDTFQSKNGENKGFLQPPRKLRQPNANGKKIGNRKDPTAK